MDMNGLYTATITPRFKGPYDLVFSLNNDDTSKTLLVGSALTTGSRFFLAKSEFEKKNQIVWSFETWVNYGRVQSIHIHSHDP